MDRRLKSLGLTEADVQLLREQHGRVWLGSIRVETPGGPEEICLVYRAPRHTDVELMAAAGRGKALQGQRNLLAAVIVAPDRQDVLDRLRPYPLAVGQFVGDHLLPLAGSDAETEAVEL